MIISALGRGVGGLLVRARCNSPCCPSHFVSSVNRQINLKAAFCKSSFGAHSVIQPSVRLPSKLQRWHFGTLASLDDSPATAGATASPFEEVSGVVHMTKFDPMYVNYVAVTGLLEQSMEASRTSQGNYLFTLKVFEDELPYEVLQIEADGDVAAAISNNLALLQEGALLSVQGRLVRPKDAVGRRVTKVFASLIGVCDDIPDSISSAAAAVAAGSFSDDVAAASPVAVAAAPALLPGAGGMPQTARYPAEEMWMELFMDPALYYDNRITKTGRQPDFKRKHDGAALWIDDRKTPSWALENLQLLPGAIPYTKQRSSGRRFDFMPAQPSCDKEADWFDLFNEYDRWWDNRTQKLNPRAPDFKHKSDGRALWVDSKDTPDWVWQNVSSALPSPPAP